MRRVVSFSRESSNRTEPPADNDIKITSVFSSTIQFDFYCLLLNAAFQRQHLLLRADFFFGFLPSGGLYFFCAYEYLILISMMTMM